jgi:hypothetical protein
LRFGKEEEEDEKVLKIDFWTTVSFFRGGSLQGCQIFLGTTYQNGKNSTKLPYQMATKYTKWPQNIPNGHKIYQMATKYTKWHKIGQMAIKYTNTFNTKTLQNLPKSGFFGLKLSHLATLDQYPTPTPLTPRFPSA